MGDSQSLTLKEEAALPSGNVSGVSRIIVDPNLLAHLFSGEYLN